MKKQEILILPESIRYKFGSFSFSSWIFNEKSFIRPNIEIHIFIAGNI